MHFTGICLNEKKRFTIDELFFFKKGKFYEVEVEEMWGMWGIYVGGGMCEVWAKDNESNAPEILS